MATKKKNILVKPLTLLEDQPVPGHEVDELQLGDYAGIVAGAAVGTTGPFTIGVFGDWGHGKTSVLRQAKSLIEADENYRHVVTVWFNAWQYEREESPLVSLVASIVKAVDDKRAELESLESVAYNVVKGWLTVAGRALAAVAYGISAKATLKVPGFGEVEAGVVAKEIVDRLESKKTPEDPLVQRSLYYSAFEALEKIGANVADSSGDSTRRPKIVVFIDDLDRCFPESALRLLENIKLVLAQKNFVFALAVDRRIIECFLAKRYKDQYGVKDYNTNGVRYLDKMVQLPLPLPPHRNRFKKYITDLLDARGHGDASPVSQALAGLADVLTIGSTANPRSLVRFINNLLVDWRLREAGRGKTDAGYLGLCAVTRILQQHLDRDLYRLLVRQQPICDIIAAIIDGKTTIESERAAIARLRSENTPAQAPRLSLRERALDRTLQEIERLDYLQELFKTPQGQSWLQDADGRRKVDELIVTEQPSTSPEVPLSQVSIINAAIRDALGKNKRATLREDDFAKVEGLDLSGKSITDVGLAHLAKVPNLCALSLDGTQVTDTGLAQLAKLVNLQSLSIDGLQISDAGLAQLVSLTNLQSLWVTGSVLTDAGLAILVALKNLRSLSLDRGQITDAGLTHITKMSALQSLSLNGTQVTDVGLMQLGRLNSLQELLLDRTRVTSVGLAHITKLSTLKELSLDETRVADAGLVHVGRLANLVFLSLADSQITNAGLVCLARLTKLQRLLLSGTRITDDGLEHLTKLERLRSVSLERTAITGKGLSQLAKLRDLKTVYISGSQIVDPAAEISDLRPDMRIIQSTTLMSRLK